MTKEHFEVADPMELMGAVIPGDEHTLDNMATAIVEEYALLGWSEERLMTLFVNPLFMATHRIYRQRGHEFVGNLVRTTIAKFRIPPRPAETDIFAPVIPLELHGEHGRVTVESPYHTYEPAPDPGTAFVPLTEES